MVKNLLQNCGLRETEFSSLASVGIDAQVEEAGTLLERARQKAQAASVSWAGETLIFLWEWMME